MVASHADVQPVGLGKRNAVDIGYLQVDYIIRRDQMVAKTDDNIRCACHEDRFVVVLVERRLPPVSGASRHKISQNRFSSRF
ncbi:MAG: hypothetical protein R2912_02550 [Eubacteriales bacterium]